MNRPLLSVLTPTVPERAEQLRELHRFMREHGGDDPRVELLALCDNRRRSVGAKRQALLDIARGDYVAFVDDDDAIAPSYFSELLPRCAGGPHVVTFEQEASVDDHKFRVVFHALCRVDEPYRPDSVSLRRRPWHVCAWRRSLAQQGVFTEVNYGEDAAWVAQVAPLARSFLHVDRVLHYYRHSSASTLAPAPI